MAVDRLNEQCAPVYFQDLVESAHIGLNKSRGNNVDSSEVLPFESERLSEMCDTRLVSVVQSLISRK